MGRVWSGIETVNFGCGQVVSKLIDPPYSRMIP